MSENVPSSLSDPDQDPVTPRLVEPEQGWIVDEEPDLVAGAAAGDTGELTAEESAIHIIAEDDAPGLTWGQGPGYVDEDPSEPPAGGSAEAPG